MPSKPDNDTTPALARLPPKRSLPSPSPEAEENETNKKSRSHPLIKISHHGSSPKTLQVATPPSEQDRKADHLHFMRTMAAIAGINPARAHLVQLQQAFIDSYFSTGVVSSHRQYFHIFYWLAPHSAALSAARDALCMIHLGSRRRHFALVHEGQRRYLAGVHHLAQDLARPGAVEDDAVLGANYTLGQADVFMAVSRTNPQYATHMAGLQQLLLKRGPASMRSPFAQALLYNIRPVSVMHGMVDRKRVFVAEKAWVEAAREGWKGRATISTELVDLSLQIPGLLEQADWLMAKPKTRKGKAGEMEVVALLTELSQVEAAIQQWLLRFYKITQAQGLPYRMRSVQNNHFFCAGLGGLAHVFPSMIEFPAFLSATTHVWVWTCLLVLRQTILDVASLHPYPTVRGQNQEASLKASVDECAVNLCQSIAYLIRPEHASNGMIACGPALHFSAAWFERQGHMQRLIWARHVREFLQRDVLLGGNYDTSLNISRPLFVWWMLPDIAVDEEESTSESGRVIEETDAAGG